MNDLMALQIMLITVAIFYPKWLLDIVFDAFDYF